jgi:acetyl-CoA carboxylase biotin carboxylase subunit
MVITGVDTTLPLFRELMNETDVVNGDYSIHWLEKMLKDKAEGDA